MAAPRSGMTLVELLVVIVLITILVSTAIPVISPGGDNRKLREASRGLNSYLQGAQARAVETGRPFGVAFRRLSSATGRGEDNAVCSIVEYVEVPPWYSGQSAASRARLCEFRQGAGIKQLALQMVAYDNTAVPTADRLPTGYDQDLVPGRFLRPGDTVSIGGRDYTLLEALSANDRFDGLRVAQTDAAGFYLPSTDTIYQEGSFVFRLQPVGQSQGALAADAGPVLRLTHDRLGGEITSLAATAAVAAAVNNPNNSQEQMYATAPAPYRILRQPIAAGGEALELPSGIAIDLQATAFGTGGRVYSPHVDAVDSAATAFNVRTGDLMLLFSPQGGIDRVSGVVDVATGATAPPTTVTGYLALCVGRRELIPAKPVGTVSQATYAEPIDLYRDVTQPGLSETEARELTDQYNWLNLDTRWVIVAGTTGAVSTVETSGVFTGGATGPVLMSEQLGAALDAVPRRVRAGGR